MKLKVGDLAVFKSRKHGHDFEIESTVIIEKINNEKYYAHHNGVLWYFLDDEVEGVEITKECPLDKGEDNCIVCN